jgi:uncharacterized protein (TIGR02391 family)
MLRESFELAQRRDGHAGSILRFIRLALDPSRELGTSKITELRVEVNEVLLLAGVELKANGDLLPVRQAKTADDARTRADRLKTRLRERQVHPDVLRYCSAELVRQNYFHAVLEAGKSVAAKIRDRTGLQLDGVELVDAAFSLKGGMPPLAFNSLQDASQQSEHEGYANFARGVAGAFYEPTSRRARIEFALSEEDALDMLATISMVHRQLDRAAITPNAPAFGSLRETGR